MRGELYALAQRHLRRVLSGQRPADSTKEEDDMYSGVTIEDRTTAAKLVVEYTLPKPKQQVGMKHSAPGGQPLAINIDLGAEKA